MKVRLQRKRLRDAMNLYDIPEEQFLKIYRLTPQLAKEFCDEIVPFIPKVNRSGLSNHIKFLVALNFYVSGSYQRRVGMDAMAYVNQTFISHSIREVSTAISSNLAKKYITFPSCPSSIEKSTQLFEANTGFPGVIGLIDCTYIALSGLDKNNEYAYVNRKGFHSLNVQIICDQNNKITNVNARYPGSHEESYIWACSKAFAYLRKNYQGPNLQKFWLLGDSGYPLQPWLMTPIRNPSNENERKYNAVHKKTRNQVKRCIGHLKGRFRCLLSENKLGYDPDTAQHIIISCAVLQNFLIEKKFPPEENYPEDIAAQNRNPSTDIFEVESFIREGKIVQNTLVHHFSTLN